MTEYRIIETQRMMRDGELAEVIGGRVFCRCDDYATAQFIREQFAIDWTNRSRPDLTYSVETSESRPLDPVSFTFRDREYHAIHVPTDSENPTDVSPDYLSLGNGWFLYAPSVHDRCELANLPTYDSALPQEWFDSHQADIALHGGWAVWIYPEGNLFGEPMYADDIELRARLSAAQGVIETLANEGRSPR